jgi:membrane-associated protease RseP (regulator of RpoE activity)
MDMTMLDLFAALFAALLVHEAGHALAAWRCGVPVLAVRVGWPRVAGWRGFEAGLVPVVGWVVVDDRAAAPRTRLWLALAGPLASLALSPLVLLPGWIGLLGLVSLILALANLLPLPPLDGGKALVEILEIVGVRVDRPLATRYGMLAIVALHVPLMLPPDLWVAGVGATVLGGVVGLMVKRA